MARVAACCAALIVLSACSAHNKAPVQAQAPVQYQPAPIPQRDINAELRVSDARCEQQLEQGYLKTILEVERCKNDHMLQLVAEIMPEYLDYWRRVAAHEMVAIERVGNGQMTVAEGELYLSEVYAELDREQAGKDQIRWQQTNDVINQTLDMQRTFGELDALRAQENAARTANNIQMMEYYKNLFNPNHP